MKAKRKRSITMKVNHCVRCGWDHLSVKFAPFRKPVDAITTHWALCPITREPILLQVYR